MLHSNSRTDTLDTLVEARTMVPTSARVVFRRLSRDFEAEFHALLIDDHIRRFLLDGKIVTPQWTRDAVTKSSRSFAETGLGIWLVFLKDEEELRPIGFAGFWAFKEVGPERQLIYALREVYTGRHFASEIAGALLHFGRAYAGLDAIIASVDEPNSASIRVLEKLGFKHYADNPGVFGRTRMYRVDKGTPPRELRTLRLLLRPWRDQDLAPFALLNADPRVMRHFPALLSRSESDAFATKIRNAFERDRYGLWAVEVIDGPAFIGFVGLLNATFDAHFTPAVEIGWRLAAEYWGHGYATEAAREVLQAASVHLGLDEVVSFTTGLNKRSRRVMEKLGMEYDSAGDFEHPNVPEGNPIRPHVLYRYRCKPSPQ